MKKLRLFRWFIASLLTLALTGCFESKEPLIGPDDADFPFSALTYSDSVGKEFKLTRAGDNYINIDEDEEVTVRLKAVDANTYVGQIAVEVDDRVSYQYALIRVADDRKSFSFSHAVAGAQARSAAAKGEFGFSPCGQTIVCIKTLDGFAEFATSMPDDGGKPAVFNVKELKQN